MEGQVYQPISDLQSKRI